MEALAPVLVDELRLVLEEFPAGTHVLVCDPERVRARAADLVRTSEEFLAASWAAAAGGGKAPVDLGAASLRSLDDVRAEAAARSACPGGRCRRSPPTPTGRTGDRSTASFDAAPAYRGDTEAVLGDIGRWLRAGLAGGRGLRRPRHRPAGRRAAARRRCRRPAGAGHRRAGRGRRGGHHRPPRGGSGVGAAAVGGAHRSRRDRSARHHDPGPLPHAVAPSQRHRPHPAGQSATSSSTSSTASAVTSRWCAGRSTAASAST